MARWSQIQKIKQLNEWFFFGSLVFLFKSLDALLEKIIVEILIQMKEHVHVYIFHVCLFHREHLQGPLPFLGPAHHQTWSVLADVVPLSMVNTQNIFQLHIPVEDLC